MHYGFIRTAIILGLLCMVGPIAIDMYLPALPAIAADLDVGIASVQTTLTVYFAAFGIAQLAYGPLADMFGRKPPLFFGLAIYLAGSLGCALAPSIEWLIAARFVQALGGAAAMVIPRAIIRDLYTGPRATRLMSTIMLVISHFADAGAARRQRTDRARRLASGFPGDGRSCRGKPAADRLRPARDAGAANCGCRSMPASWRATR